MASFIGDYTGKIDPKGRVSLPSALKKQMEGSADAETFVAKRDIYEKCIILYTKEEWERQTQILRAKLNPYNKDHNQFLREFFRGTVEITLDSSNRLLLPERLSEYAEIDKDVYFSGQDKKIEIWAKAVYEAKEQSSDDFADLAQKIMGGELVGF
jgi:MraZ protein